MQQFFSADGIEQYVIGELQEELSLSRDSAEHIILSLEVNPSSVELLHELFRNLHTLKGNLGILSLSPLVDLVGALEDILSMMREQQLSYTPLFSDILLIALDKINLAIQECFTAGGFHYPKADFDTIIANLKRIKHAEPAQQESLLFRILVRLDPNLLLPAEVKPELESPPDTMQPSEELHFFYSLMQSIEKRSPYWQGRSQRQLKLALLINRYAGSLVDEQQLTAACYLHDFGMGLLPYELLHKRGKYNNAERQQLESHIYCSAKLLDALPHWQEAKTIILQHHERFDGTGYPFSLADKHIHDGAKILAIVDTFDALTHERSHTSHLKRPMRRAIIEINNLAGTQLCPFWVSVFNLTMQVILD